MIANFKIKTNVMNSVKFTYVVVGYMTNEIMFIGCDKMNDICNLNSLVRLPNYNNNEVLEIFVLDSCYSIVEEKNKTSHWYNILTQGAGAPIYNSVQTQFNTHQGKVICNETGQRFRTITEAASVMGIGQGNLSNHLAGKPGFKTVKGYTFKREALPAIQPMGPRPMFDKEKVLSMINPYHCGYYVNK